MYRLKVKLADGSVTEINAYYCDYRKFAGREYYQLFTEDFTHITMINKVNIVDIIYESHADFDLEE